MSKAELATQTTFGPVKPDLAVPVTPELQKVVDRGIEFYWEHRGHVVSPRQFYKYIWGENVENVPPQAGEVLQVIRQQLPDGEQILRVGYRGHKPHDFLCVSGDTGDEMVLNNINFTPKTPQKLKEWLSRVQTLKRTNWGDYAFSVSKLVVVASRLYAANYGQPVSNAELDKVLEIHGLKSKGDPARERLRVNLLKGVELYSLGHSEHYMLASSRKRKMSYPDELLSQEIPVGVRRTIAHVLILHKDGKSKFKTALMPQPTALLLYAAVKWMDSISADNIPEEVLGKTAISDGGNCVKQYAMEIRRALAGSSLELYSEWGTGGYRLGRRKEIGETIPTRESRRGLRKWPKDLKELGRLVNEPVIKENQFLISRFTPSERKILNLIGSAKGMRATYAELARILGDESEFKTYADRGLLKTNVNTINIKLEESDLPYRLHCRYKFGYQLVKV
ncbi:MAG: hypothetical protein AAB874_00435 [Patescibacteria group bacterium]